MLRFTGAGVVSEPDALQIRVARHHPGRVPAGAPEPPRDLTDDEIVANIRHFTEGRRGPRSRPCTALILAGLEPGRAGRLSGVLDQAHAWGIRHVTLHADAAVAQEAVAALGPRVSALALTLRAPTDADVIASIREAGVHVAVVVLLEEGRLDAVDALLEPLAVQRPDRVVLTWPYPPLGRPAPAALAGATCGRALEWLTTRGLSAKVRGLPPCVVPGTEDGVHRSRNRFYVDAAHQRDDALLFHPDIVRFGRQDVCRFCSVADRCEGVPDEWLNRGLVGTLRPI